MKCQRIRSFGVIVTIWCLGARCDVTIPMRCVHLKEPITMNRKSLLAAAAMVCAMGASSFAYADGPAPSTTVAPAAAEHVQAPAHAEVREHRAAVRHARHERREHRRAMRHERLEHRRAMRRARHERREAHAATAAAATK